MVDVSASRGLGVEVTLWTHWGLTQALAVMILSRFPTFIFIIITHTFLFWGHWADCSDMLIANANLSGEDIPMVIQMNIALNIQYYFNYYSIGYLENVLDFWFISGWLDGRSQGGGV